MENGYQTKNLLRFLNSNLGIILSIPLYIGAFIFDTVSQRGVMAWCPYLLPMLLYFPLKRSQTIFLSVIGALLIFLGLSLSPPGIPSSLALFNRIQAVVLFWLVTFSFESKRNKQKELEQTRRFADIGQLASIVAHELRSPLAAIKMAATNIKRKIDKKGMNNSDFQSHLQNIDKKILESNEIINNLLFYSRISTPRLKKINLVKVIDESMKTARLLHPGYKIEEKKEWNSKVFLEIKGDELQLKEIFTNVINNAIESFENKQGTVTVSLETNHDLMIVKVHDNGKGISQKDIKKICTPFYTTKTRGLGLGTTIATQIVKLHKGKMKIESKIGQGSCVTICLPIKNF